MRNFKYILKKLMVQNRVLLDEPFLFLDKKNRKTILRNIKD